MKIALAQINTANGDLVGNSKKIQRAVNRARADQAQLVIFPELALLGYPPKDFIFQSGFLAQAKYALEQLAGKNRDVAILLGGMEGRSNVIYLLQNGTAEVVARKNLLPNYDVFDERRYFDESTSLSTIRIHQKRVAISICEDGWAATLGIYARDPMEKLAAGTLDYLINISASPFHLQQDELRKKMMASHSSRLGVPSVYVNLVGGNDELLFDGGSFITDAHGQVCFQSPFFEENVSTVDMSNLKSIIVQEPLEHDVLQRALVLGLRDFVRKCGFQRVVLGLSGGIDSALVLLLSLEAFGKQNVFPIFLPSRFTSTMSKEDVRQMADRLEIPMAVTFIDPIVDVMIHQLEATVTSPIKKLTAENVQARVRGNLLMAFAAEKNALVIGTGNKSELATGYATLYGDLIGGLLPLGDLYKHQVYALAKGLNEKYQAIPERVFTREPSAELSENQKDSDRLPPYPVLDRMVKLFVEDQSSIEEMIVQGFSKEQIQSVIPMIVQSEFKRKQAPPVLRVSKKAFGLGRRFPIARKTYETE